MANTRMHFKCMPNALSSLARHTANLIIDLIGRNYRVNDQYINLFDAVCTSPHLIMRIFNAYGWRACVCVWRLAWCMLCVCVRHPSVAAREYWRVGLSRASEPSVLRFQLSPHLGRHQSCLTADSSARRTRCWGGGFVWACVCVRMWPASVREDVNARHLRSRALLCAKCCNFNRVRNENIVFQTPFLLGERAVATWWRCVDTDGRMIRDLLLYYTVTTGLCTELNNIIIYWDIYRFEI